MNATANNVINEVLKERERQDAKWGGPSHDDSHERKDWVRFCHSYIPCVSLCDDEAYYRERMIEVAALAIAAVESLDRKKTPQ